MSERASERASDRGREGLFAAGGEARGGAGACVCPRAAGGRAAAEGPGEERRATRLRSLLLLLFSSACNRCGLIRSRPPPPPPRGTSSPGSLQQRQPGTYFLERRLCPRSRAGGSLFTPCLPPSSYPLEGARALPDLETVREAPSSAFPPFPLQRTYSRSSTSDALLRFHTKLEVGGCEGENVGRAQSAE